MEQLRIERIARVRLLDQNTIAMRLIAVEARAAGHSAYQIAKLLGVTHRTASLWLKK
jgi:transposase